VLLRRQRSEGRLLLMPLSGYASVYNVNIEFQRVREKCRGFAQGAQG
jgi:hypothetical protein